MDPKDIIKNIDKIENSHTYQSGLKGAIDETGKTLETVVKAVNTALLPVQGMIWGGEKIKEWLNEKVAKKLEHVQPEKIIPPNPHIAGPAIEALKFTAQEEELREMFANLLANSINSDKSIHVHPAFVDIIKSMNNIDAAIFRVLANDSPVATIDIGIKQDKDNSVRYVARNVTLLGEKANIKKLWAEIPAIENLERMGLCSIIKTASLNEKELYENIENNINVKKLIEENTAEDGQTKQIEKGGIEITQFGRMFASSCVS